MQHLGERYQLLRTAAGGITQLRHLPGVGSPAVLSIAMNSSRFRRTMAVTSMRMASSGSDR
ncbi:hypothetical protein BTZ20_4657 [Rhodococcus sp. MTM3W5.2]|nr:hypothetical protein BTZ20_4657 [Rhodococcus sp. MTM3W5.2]